MTPSKRQAETEAIYYLDVCVWPSCTAYPALVGTTKLPLCIDHAIRTWGVLDRDQAERPALTEHQLNRRVERERTRLRETQAAESRAIEPGWIYYVQVTDRIKIGYSTDVRQRMRAYPPHAELLAVHPGTPTLERQIHQDLAGHLAQGREWFRPNPEVTAHIGTVLAQFGPPPKRFIYTFRDGPQQRIKVRRSARR